MGAPRIRLVVLNYNGGTLVERCVDHLERLDWPEDRLEIVVVDNASTDGSAERLGCRPRVRLIPSPVNAGFPANNLALRDLDDVDYVGLVNNDAFVEHDYLHPLVEALEGSADLGAVCPKILLAHRFVDAVVSCAAFSAPNDDRSLGVRLSGVEVMGEDRWRNARFVDGFHAEERAGSPDALFRWTDGRATLGVPCLPGEATARVRLSSPEPVEVRLDAGAGPITAACGPEPTWVDLPLGPERYDVLNNVGSRLVRGGFGGDRGFLEPDTGQYEEPSEVFAWCGAGVLLRPAFLADVGLFDEGFFMYYEDTDLSWRGRSRGWSYRYVPQARMRHIHAATSVEGSPLFNHHVQRNRLLMLVKNAPARVVGRALVGYGRELVVLSWRDVLRPLLRGRRPAPRLVAGRVGALASFGRLLPGALRDRRRIRGRQLVPDDVLLGWAE